MIGISDGVSENELQILGGDNVIALKDSKDLITTLPTMSKLAAEVSRKYMVFMNISIDVMLNCEIMELIKVALNCDLLIF